jgi:hypothetical protein
MKVKSLQKQLMAAIAMVLVAAIALSSATYAWFVNNAQVTATNVNVQAATAYSLLISHKNGNDAAWGTTTALTKELTTLTPVSTVGEVMETEGGLTLTKAVAANGSDAVPAVGIGDGTTVAVGDVRFVTNTKWESNYVTGVSEVSKDSVVGTAEDDTSNTYFYSETVYLKAAQAGNIYLDNSGIGIVWAEWDATNNKVSETTTQESISDFMELEAIDTTSMTAGSDALKNATAYNADLASAQALLKTLRVGLLVTQTASSETTRTWHEYQLVADKINDDTAVNTTLNSESGAEGITKAVSALDSNNAVATNSAPKVAEISNVKTMSSKVITDYAITGSQSTIATATSDADVIATATVNEEIQVDIYVWMEGCDYDTVAANITSFAGTGVRGLQLGFCLGEVKSAS